MEVKTPTNQLVYSILNAEYEVDLEAEIDRRSDRAWVSLVKHSLVFIEDIQTRIDNLRPDKNGRLSAYDVRSIIAEWVTALRQQ